MTKITIPKRLRLLADNPLYKVTYDFSHPQKITEPDTLREAADEIERLEEIIQELRNSYV